MMTNLVNCQIEQSYRSDHSMVILELEYISFVRGKGLWKFNNSLLYDLEYSNIVKKNQILEVKKQYGALVYNLRIYTKFLTMIFISLSIVNCF